MPSAACIAGCPFPTSAPWKTSWPPPVPPAPGIYGAIAYAVAPRRPLGFVGFVPRRPPEFAAPSDTEVGKRNEGAGPCDIQPFFPRIRRFRLNNGPPATGVYAPARH